MYNSKSKRGAYEQAKMEKILMLGMEKNLMHMAIENLSGVKTKSRALAAKMPLL